MKPLSFLFLWLLSIGYFPSKAIAADARVITENGTNILAIGIDNRDFEVVRFYMKGDIKLELRPDNLLFNQTPNTVERSVLPPIVRGGSSIVTALETTKAVTFNRPMQDATYIVLATPSGATTVSVPVASKTTNGFTLNLSAGHQRAHRLAGDQSTMS